MKISLEHLIEETKEQIVSLMNQNGLDAISDFTIKIKELANTEDLACYRGSTVFSSRAIFWINENFYEIVKDKLQIDNEEEIDKYTRIELWKTILHEVGQSVADLLRFMARREGSLESKELVSNWIGQDEEDFAEDFIWIIQTNQIKNQNYYPYYEKMIKDIMQY